MDVADFDTEFNPLFNPVQPRTSVNINSVSFQNELEQVKSENKILRQQVLHLETENKMKEELLDQKSKHILSLKHQIQVLSQQLHETKGTINTKPRQKTSKQLSIKRGRLQLTKSLSYGSDDDNHEMPYLVPQISISMSISSNLSAAEQACTLSFPKTIQDSKPLINILSPIAEHPNDILSDNKPTKLKLSDNNQNIQRKEWENCMAALDMSDVDTNHLNVLGLNHSDYHSDDESSASPSPSFLSNETEKLLEKNMRTNQAIFSEDDSDDMVSYMSDNTMLLIDMSYQRFGGNKNVDVELSQRSIQHYVANSNGKDGSNECDVVIKSPLDGMDIE